MHLYVYLIVKCIFTYNLLNFYWRSHKNFLKKINFLLNINSFFLIKYHLLILHHKSYHKSNELIFLKSLDNMK